MSQIPADILEAAEREYPYPEYAIFSESIQALFKMINSDRDKYIAGAIAERERDRWIKVIDRLPEHKESVLFFSNHRDAKVVSGTFMSDNLGVRFIAADGGHYKPLTEQVTYGCTHWQPSPEKPTN